MHESKQIENNTNNDKINKNKNSDIKNDQILPKITNKNKNTNNIPMTAEQYFSNNECTVNLQNKTLKYG